MSLLALCELQMVYLRWSVFTKSTNLQTSVSTNGYISKHINLHNSQEFVLTKVGHESIIDPHIADLSEHK